MLNQKELKQFLHYEPDTGIFVWLKSRGRKKKGSIARSINKGYIYIRINKKLYSAHRLAWLYMTGEFPINEIDHINGIKNDNRFSNLREANSSQNSCNRGKNKNNSSGFKCVHYRKDTNKWGAYISKNNKRYHIGYYNTPEDASEAYVKKAKELHGDFYFEKRKK